MMNGIDWTNCSPCEAGIRSESISDALDFLESHMIPMHSLFVIRGGKAAFEAYWEPYHARTLHRMFSVTKSLVSLAAGVLVSDGRISLDDKVLDYFPEAVVPDRFRILTLRHMLSMRTCHSRASHKLVPGSSYTGSYSDDWVGSFFRTIDGDHQPGTFFSYDDTAAHVVGAIVEKVSRMDLISFMRSTFLKDVPFSQDAYIMKEGTGVSKGNSGLMARPRDLAELAYRVGKRSLHGVSGEYIDEALSFQADTSEGTQDGVSAFRHGYGYFFWLIDGGWAMYGNGGQLVLSYPDEDLLVVTTADVQAIQGGTGTIMDAVQIIRKGIGSKEVGDEKALMDRISSLSLIHVSGSAVPSGAWRYGCLSAAVDGGSISISLGKEEGRISIVRGSHRIGFIFGYCRNAAGPVEGIAGYTAAASGAWKEDDTLVILSQFMGEEIGSLSVRVSIQGEMITVTSKLCGELSFTGFSFTAEGGMQEWTEE